MKKFMITTLLVSAMAVSSMFGQAPKHFGDAYSAFEAALHAAPENSQDMKVILAAYWDLLPGGAAFPNAEKRKAELKEGYKTKFKVYPNAGEVVEQLAKKLTALITQKALQRNTEEKCGKNYKSYQTAIKKLEGTNATLAAEKKIEQDKLNDLGKAITLLTRSEKNLIADMKDLLALPEATGPEESERAEQVLHAYSIYAHAYAMRERIARELGNINFPESDEFLDFIASSQLAHREGISAQALEEAKAEADKAVATMTLDDIEKKLDEYDEKKAAPTAPPVGPILP